MPLDPSSRVASDKKENVIVTEAEEYILTVALEQTLTTGVFSPYLHNFQNATISSSDWRLVLKNLEKKDLLTHYGLTLSGVRYVHHNQIADNSHLALIEHYKREVLRTLLSYEAGKLFTRGIPISTLIEIVPVSYALLMLALGTLEIEQLVEVDRRRIITPGPMLRDKMPVH